MNTPDSLAEFTQQNCPRCGASVLPDADECPACGQSLCPACGAAIGADDTRCAACGATFDLACPACDAALKPDDARCPACGAAFQPTVEGALPTPPAKPREQLIREAYRSGAEDIKHGISGPHSQNHKQRTELGSCV